MGLAFKRFDGVITYILICVRLIYGVDKQWRLRRRLCAYGNGNDYGCTVTVDRDRLNRRLAAGGRVLRLARALARASGGGWRAWRAACWRWRFGNRARARRGRRALALLASGAKGKGVGRRLAASGEGHACTFVVTVQCVSKRASAIAYKRALAGGHRC